MFVSMGCSPNVPSSFSTPPSVPGAPSASGPRRFLYCESAYGAQAARPSSAPRRITSTKREFLSAAASASRANGASNVNCSEVRSSVRRSTMTLSPLELGRRDQECERLAAALGVADAGEGALVGARGQHGRRELERVAPVADSLADRARPLDALQQRVAAVPGR